MDKAIHTETYAPQVAFVAVVMGCRCGQANGIGYAKPARRGLPKVLPIDFIPRDSCWHAKEEILLTPTATAPV
jgi:hypothetical protein